MEKSPSDSTEKDRKIRRQQRFPEPMVPPARTRMGDIPRPWAPHRKMKETKEEAKGQKEG